MYQCYIEYFDNFESNVPSKFSEDCKFTIWSLIHDFTSILIHSYSRIQNQIPLTAKNTCKNK